MSVNCQDFCPDPYFRSKGLCDLQSAKLWNQLAVQLASSRSCDVSFILDFESAERNTTL